MYRVMLIDDEQNARNLLASSIDWAKFDMEIAGEAASGIEAINEIDTILPDIAFVDISMPFMNGIEFTELATKRYPDLKIIIMTAFNEFEYARKCIRLPVFDYMLKPFVRTEVEDNLIKLKAILDSRVAETDSPFDTPIDIEESAIEQIKAYLDQNFTDSKINLASVAQHFGFSASYLSRKFKSETGKNFIEYLSEVRMVHAISLAKAGKKMFVTSKEVGIPDPNYFGRCFKKYTGLSYSDYVAAQK